MLLPRSSRRAELSAIFSLINAVLESSGPYRYPCRCTDRSIRVSDYPTLEPKGRVRASGVSHVRLFRRPPRKRNF